MNDIIKLLNLKGPDILVSSVDILDGVKRITLEKHPVPQYCPYCGTRMHSRGIRKRTVNHPVMQDGLRVSY